MLPTASAELVWTKGEPVLLVLPANFIRKGSVLELSAGNVLVPLEESTKRTITKHSMGHVYTWTFLLPDGSITEFYLAKRSYEHVRAVDEKISRDLRQFFRTKK
jgi:hypothetical protein